MSNLAWKMFITFITFLNRPWKLKWNCQNLRYLKRIIHEYHETECERGWFKIEWYRLQKAMSSSAHICSFWYEKMNLREERALARMCLCGHTLAHTRYRCILKLSFSFSWVFIKSRADHAQTPTRGHPPHPLRLSLLIFHFDILPLRQNGKVNGAECNASET